MREILVYLAKGGITMIPLALCSIIALALIIERIVALRRKKIVNPAIVNIIDSLKNEEDMNLALSLCEKNPGIFARIIKTGLENRKENKEILKETISEIGRHESYLLGRPLIILETIASISPLLGLSGTVLGMIRVFDVISKEGLGQADLLSAGISEALITTVTGLFIAIPTLVAYNYFSSLANDIILEIEQHSILLVKKLHLFKQEPKHLD